MPNRKTASIFVVAGVGLLTAAWALGSGLAEQTQAGDQNDHVLKERNGALEAENRKLRRELSALRSAAEPASSRMTPRDESSTLHEERRLAEERDASAGLEGRFERAALAASPPRLTADQRRLLTLRIFGELLRELQLDEQRSEALLEVLGNHAERAQAAVMRMGPIPRDPEDAEEMRATYEALREERRRDIIAAIGTDQAARFEAVERTAPARMELKQLRDHLDGAGAPISDEQRAKLLALMTRGSDIEPPQPEEGESMEDGFARYREWRSKRSAQVRQHANTILTPAQLEQLDAYYATNEALQALNVPPEP